MGEFRTFVYSVFWTFCSASYHEQYRVPLTYSDKWESYIYSDKEYLIQNLPVNWENAKILCRGIHNATLVLLDTKDKADFLAEALSESQFSLDSVWVGARRGSAEDPAGYRWSNGLELVRTAGDVAGDDTDDDPRYPVWQNRTRVPYPESGADCVALARRHHDRPVFLDLPCRLERTFVCQRDARQVMRVSELKSIRCQSGLYRVYDGRLNWDQAAAYCIIRKMMLANIATMSCLKKIGTAMLKTRPSIESAWLGARGSLGRWAWSDSGENIFAARSDAFPEQWPPVRDRTSMKQSGCLMLDRHAAHAPVLLEARCERKMQFICYQTNPASSLRTRAAPPSDDNYYYVLVRDLYYWQHAYENCARMNGTLASVDTEEMLVQLLLVMAENREEPVDHIWLSGRLNMSRDTSDAVHYGWYSPDTNRMIPDGKRAVDGYVPPWLDSDFSLDSSCLNLDRLQHLQGLLYGLPCDTAQASICLIEKSRGVPATNTTERIEEN